MSFVGPLFKQDGEVMPWKELKSNFRSSNDDLNVINDGGEFEDIYSEENSER